MGVPRHPLFFLGRLRGGGKTRKAGGGGAGADDVVEVSARAAWLAKGGVRLARARLCPLSCCLHEKLHRHLLSTHASHAPAPRILHPLQVAVEPEDVRAERLRVEALQAGDAGEAIVIRDLHKTFPAAGGAGCALPAVVTLRTASVAAGAAAGCGPLACMRTGRLLDGMLAPAHARSPAAVPLPALQREARGARPHAGHRARRVLWPAGAQRRGQEHHAGRAHRLPAAHFGCAC